MLQAYLEELRKTELLSSDEELQLWQQRADGDMVAHTRLMTSYQPLVFKIAMGFKLSEPDTMELIQEGMVGLLEASENYDYKRGVAFSLFATYRIRGRMIDFLKNRTDLGVIYLEEEVHEGFPLVDTLSVASDAPSDIAERHMLGEKIQQAMNRLPAKEKQVLTGLLIDDAPAQDVADNINVSLGHVYRLQKQGVRRIRGMLSRFIHDFNKV